jgi:FkbM family methyltransferase
MAVIIDVGAAGFPNGNETYRKGDTVLLFEPIERPYNTLVNKFGNNNNFKVYNLALSNTKGKAIFYNTRKDNCSSLRMPNAEVLLQRDRNDIAEYTESIVETDLLDNYTKHLDVIDFLKLDTQGSEYEVLQGGLETLAKTKKLKVEVEKDEWYVGQKIAPEVDEYIKSFGFTRYKTNDNKYHADYYYTR